MSEQENGGQGFGGGPKTERIEGSLTDGGSVPGAAPEDRSFGAGQAAPVSQPGHTGPQGEGGGTMSGRGQESGDGWREQFKDAHEQAERNRSHDNIGGGGVAGAGTGGAGLAGTASATDAEGGLSGDAGMSGGPASGAIFEGQGEDPGATDEGAAGPGTEHSGYGNTPPR